MGRESAAREAMTEWSSSTAIWWVSRSESLEREVRMRCFSSTMARWEEREGDGDGFEDEEDDEEEGGGGWDWC